MTPAEFRKRLGQLQEVITRGLHYYAAWKNLRFYKEGEVSWSLEEQNEVFDRFRGFFTPVVGALLNMALMQFAKVFDRNRRTASLWNLLEAARQDTSLVPGHTSVEVDAVSSQLQESERTLTGLKRMRDQQLAHVDANPAPVDPLLAGEFDLLVERVKSASNWLSTAHGGHWGSWELQLREVEWQTSRIVGVLVEELHRKRLKAEQIQS